MSTMDDQIAELMRSVKRPGVDPSPSAHKARPQPQAGRYYLIKQDLEDTDDNYKVIAQRHGITIKEVRQIARAENLERDEPQTKGTYDKDRRKVLIDAAFGKIEGMVEDAATPKDIQQLVSAMAVLIDKRRLEDGEATSREEHSLTDGAREALAAKLEDVTDRRRKSFIVLQQLEQATILPTNTITPLPTDDTDDTDSAENIIDGDFTSVA